MQAAVALNLLMSRLGNRTEAALRASCLVEMQLAQDMLSLELTPWFLLGTDATLATVASSRDVAVPADFLREHDEGVMIIVNASGTYNEAPKGDYDLLIQKYGFTGTGDPALEYALVGLNFKMFPIPTAVRTVILSKYYQKTTDLADSVMTNSWLTYAPDLLIAETGIVMALQYLQDEDIAQGFVGMAAKARKRLQTDTISREEANRSRQMGDD